MRSLCFFGFLILGGLRALAQPSEFDSVRARLIQEVKAPCSRRSLQEWLQQRNSLLIQLHILRLNYGLQDMGTSPTPHSERDAWRARAYDLQRRSKQRWTTALQKELKTDWKTPFASTGLDSILDQDTEILPDWVHGEWAEVCGKIKDSVRDIDSDLERLDRASLQLGRILNAWKKSLMSADVRAGLFAQELELRYPGFSEKPLPAKADLSARFFEPETQYNYTTCIARSIAADVEEFFQPSVRIDSDTLHTRFAATSHAAVIEKLRKDPSIVEPFFMDVSRAIRQNQPFALTSEQIPLVQKLARDHMVLNARFEEWNKSPVQIDVSLSLLMTMAAPLKAGATEPLLRIKRFIHQSFGHYKGLRDDETQLNLLRYWLVNQGPLLLSTNSASYRYADHWIQPDLSDTSGHMFNIVGFGTAISPFDLKEQPYFLIRDSFILDPVHHFISAQDLFRIANGVIDILE